VKDTEQKTNSESSSDEAVLSDTESELDKHTLPAGDDNNAMESEMEFGQNHNMAGILVVSIFSFWMTVDSG
jgi:hypothetical protein